MGFSMKYLVQCDFDGTITMEDVSYLLLDEFAQGSWRELLDDYQEGKMSVGAFNTAAFAMIKRDEKALLDFVLGSGRVRLREGFAELLDCCKAKRLDFAIVSNGQDFYIKALLRKMGINNVRYYAATSSFDTGGVVVHYIGPDGCVVTDCFKETYARLFLSQGYRLIYIGNGLSDAYPARLADHVFATGEMVRRCNELGIKCTPFDDLHEVARALEDIAGELSIGSGR
jgi:2-hydroxy-3-keto-5-methylthiopentenyl-1-phosphate phosphatase